MNRLNGIIISGKVYEAVEKENGNPCIDCELKEECGITSIIDLCITLGNLSYFRFSQELTNKLNKGTFRTYDEKEECVVRRK